MSRLGDIIISRDHVPRRAFAGRASQDTFVGFKQSTVLDVHWRNPHIFGAATVGELRSSRRRRLVSADSTFVAKNAKTALPETDGSLPAWAVRATLRYPLHDRLLETATAGVGARASWHSWRLDLTGPHGLTDTTGNSRPTRR